MESLTSPAFLQRFRSKWKQGQHVLISGPTGSGKSYVAEDIKEIRQYVIVIASKKNDETLDGYSGFKKMATWPPDWNTKLVLFWRKPKNIEDLQGMRQSIYSVMKDVFD